MTCDPRFAKPNVPLPPTHTLPPRFSLFFNHRQPSTFHFFTNPKYFPSTPLMRLIFAYPKIFGYSTEKNWNYPTRADKMFYPHIPSILYIPIQNLSEFGKTTENRSIRFISYWCYGRMDGIPGTDTVNRMDGIPYTRYAQKITGIFVFWKKYLFIRLH